MMMMMIVNIISTIVLQGAGSGRGCRAGARGAGPGGARVARGAARCAGASLPKGETRHPAASRASRAAHATVISPRHAIVI